MEKVITGTLKIEANIPEDQFMESILNMYFSGLEVMLPFVFYAFAHQWHIDKLTYYMGLMKK